MTRKYTYTRPPGIQRRISSDAVGYLYDAVMYGKSVRHIAAEYGVKFQRVHQQISKFPDALRRDAKLCADFVRWFNSLCVDVVPTADVEKWVADNAPQP